MARKPWKYKKTPTTHNEQKFKWNKKKIFNSFEDADSFRNILKKEELHVKIRRCGPSGTQFKVLTGTPIKTNKNTKGEKNATK